MSLQGPTLLRIGRALAAAALGIAISSVVALAALGYWDFLSEDSTAPLALLAIGLGVVSWQAFSLDARNGSVWALTVAAFFSGIVAASGALTVLLARRSVDGLTLDVLRTMSPAELPRSAAIAVSVRIWAQIPALLSVPTLGVLLFPDGRPPSPRWRLIGWFGAGSVVVATIAGMAVMEPTSDIPIGVVDRGNEFKGLAGAIADMSMPVAVVAALFCLVSLAVRYRRSSGIARRQIRWIAWGGSAFLLALIAAVVIDGSGADGPLSSIVFLVGELVLMLSLGVAITKYRLYSIDLVISKTVAYLSLAAAIALLYGAAVLALVLVFGSDNGQGGGLGIALPLLATVVVAVAFEPLRLRLERLATRVLYGERAAPSEVLSELASQLSDTAAGEGLAGLAGLVRRGTGADSARVWLRVGGRLRLEATSPEEARSEGANLTSFADLPTSELDLSVPVRHGEDLLGALSITKSRAHPVTPADKALLADVAAGAVLLLLNLRLNAELASRASQLQASRRRLIAAQDSARHRLERDLHDGAQQQVVALKVRLGLVKAIAEREGADDVAARVVALADATQQAVDGLRGVARGIYPPLLETEGLEPAINTAYRSVDLPIELHTGVLPRYSKEVEETAYFCVLAAIARAKMAGATSARVDMEGDDASLSIAVGYDAVGGGDLIALTDRIDAYGGTLTVTTASNATSLTMAFPVTGETDEKDLPDHQLALDRRVAT